MASGFGYHIKVLKSFAAFFLFGLGSGNVKIAHFRMRGMPSDRRCAKWTPLHYHPPPSDSVMDSLGQSGSGGVSGI